MVTLATSRLLTVAALAAAEGGHAGGASLVSPDLAVTVATWITFGLLLFLIARFGWKPFTDALDAREQSIADSITRAENARREAEELLKQYAAKLAAATTEADAVLSEGRSRAEQVAARLQTEAQANATNLIEKAKQTIEGERQKAIVELRSIVAEAAVSLASKIIKEELDPKRHEKLIDGVVGDIRKGAH